MLKATDFIMAFIAAIVIMAINVAISFAVVAVYAYFIEPGHDNAFYEAAARDIAPWSSVVAGVFLFFGAAFIFAKREPARNAAGFAIAIWACYTAVEFLILAGEGALASMIPIVSLSLLTKLIAAIGGARAASQKAV